MRFVTYQIDSKISKISRVGILINFDQTEIVLDLNLSFASLLKEQGKEPKYLDYANLEFLTICVILWQGEIPHLKQLKKP